MNTSPPTLVPNDRNAVIVWLLIVMVIACLAWFGHQVSRSFSAKMRAVADVAHDPHAVGTAADQPLVAHAVRRFIIL